MITTHDPSKATHIEVDAGVRYWEDASVNGVEDTEGTLIPGRKDTPQGPSWQVRIDLERGRIEGWPVGTTANIHYKVCDAGIYWLTDQAGQRLAQWRGYYVPNQFLCHGSEGFGDYIIMDVGEDGTIAGYRRPEIDLERWKALSAMDG